MSIIEHADAYTHTHTLTYTHAQKYISVCVIIDITVSKGESSSPGANVIKLFTDLVVYWQVFPEFNFCG
jgi:hypothetical protein